MPRPAFRNDFLAPIFLLLCTAGFAEEEPATKLELPPNQQKLTFQIKVANEDGEPVAGAKVTPWALRWGGSHGGWDKDDKFAGFGPTVVESDNDGIATIEFPKFRIAKTREETVEVTITVDHFDYAFVRDLYIDVPRDKPFPVRLRKGAGLDVLPLFRDKPVDLKTLHAIWSDPRSWQSEPRPNDDGGLSIPPMSHGQNTILLFKLDGEKATHFSRISEVVLKQAETLDVKIPLEKARRITGIFSENVPRPIVNGRVKVNTLRPSREDSNRVGWRTWAAVEPDGSFTIDGWPAHERLQVTALCDGYCAKSGEPPKEVEDATPSSHIRPQVFSPTAGSIEVAMEPMGTCIVSVVDQKGKPIVGANVSSNPNVGWWNGGSQIYCHPLVRSERLLATKDYKESIEKDDYPYPYRGKADEEGKVRIELPVGKRRLRAYAKGYRTLGRSGTTVNIEQGESKEVTISLRPEQPNE